MSDIRFFGDAQYGRVARFLRFDGTPERFIEDLRTANYPFAPTIKDGLVMIPAPFAQTITVHPGEWLDVDAPTPRAYADQTFHQWFRPCPAPPDPKILKELADLCEARRIRANRLDDTTVIANGHILTVAGRTVTLHDSPGRADVFDWPSDRGRLACVLEAV